jgi:hypothetical protein
LLPVDGLIVISDGAVDSLIVDCCCCCLYNIVRCTSSAV